MTYGHVILISFDCKKIVNNANKYWLHCYGRYYWPITFRNLVPTITWVAPMRTRYIYALCQFWSKICCFLTILSKINCLPNEMSEWSLFYYANKFSKDPLITYSRKAITKRVDPERAFIKNLTIAIRQLKPIAKRYNRRSRPGETMKHSLVCVWTARQIEFKIYTRHSLIYFKSFVQLPTDWSLDFCLDEGWLLL